MNCLRIEELESSEESYIGCGGALCSVGDTFQPIKLSHLITLLLQARYSQLSDKIGSYWSVKNAHNSQSFFVNYRDYIAIIIFKYIAS